jgi:DNA-binding transcriptional ArsR family regulator
MTYEEALSAIDDPTRRLLLERLTAGPRSAGELAEGLPMSRPAVSQHLRVLREARLVNEQREGTRRVYRLDPRGLSQLRAYFDGFWQRAMADFQDSANHAPKENGNEHPDDDAAGAQDGDCQAATGSGLRPVHRQDRSVVAWRRRPGR